MFGGEGRTDVLRSGACAVSFDIAMASVSNSGRRTCIWWAASYKQVSNHIRATIGTTPTLKPTRRRLRSVRRMVDMLGGCRGRWTIPARHRGGDGSMMRRAWRLEGGDVWGCSRSRSECNSASLSALQQPPDLDHTGVALRPDSGELTSFAYEHVCQGHREVCTPPLSRSSAETCSLWSPSCQKIFFQFCTCWQLTCPDSVGRLAARELD